MVLFWSLTDEVTMICHWMEKNSYYVFHRKKKIATCWWINNDRVFGWTIPLNRQAVNQPGQTKLSWKITIMKYSLINGRKSWASVVSLKKDGWISSIAQWWMDGRRKKETPPAISQHSVHLHLPLISHSFPLSLSLFLSFLLATAWSSMSDKSQSYLFLPQSHFCVHKMSGFSYSYNTVWALNLSLVLSFKSSATMTSFHY